MDTRLEALIAKVGALETMLLQTIACFAPEGSPNRAALTVLFELDAGDRPESGDALDPQKAAKMAEWETFVEMAQNLREHP